MQRFEQFRSIENADTNKAYLRAQDVLEKAINPEDFEGVYDDIEKDVAYVERMEKEFDEQSKREPVELERTKKIATILEGIILEAGELYNWFGENASTIVPSRYDDIKNGVDCIVEFEEGENEATHLALAIDVISGPEVERKINRIKKDIEENHLSEIKYFSSDFLGVKERKTNIPKVVIGADKKHVADVMELWLNNKKKELSEHHLQIQILKEISMQLQAFADYANSIGATALGDIYKSTLVIVRRILRGKIINPEDRELIEEDEVYQALKQNLQSLKTAKAA